MSSAKDQGLRPVDLLELAKAKEAVRWALSRRKDGMVAIDIATLKTLMKALGEEVT